MAWRRCAGRWRAAYEASRPGCFGWADQRWTGPDAGEGHATRTHTRLERRPTRRNGTVQPCPHAQTMRRPVFHSPSLSLELCIRGHRLSLPISLPYPRLRVSCLVQCQLGGDSACRLGQLFQLPSLFLRPRLAVPAVEARARVCSVVEEVLAPQSAAVELLDHSV